MKLVKRVESDGAARLKQHIAARLGLNTTNHHHFLDAEPSKPPLFICEAIHTTSFLGGTTVVEERPGPRLTGSDPTSTVASVAPLPTRYVAPLITASEGSIEKVRTSAVMG